MRLGRSPDPHDDFLLALCEAARVDRLVTGDKADLLALERHGTARIVTAAGLAGSWGFKPLTLRVPSPSPRA